MPSFRHRSLSRSLGATADGLLQDLRYATRSLLRRRGFTLATLALLALGVGANTAVFSVVHGVLLKPLPLPQSDRLVQIHQAYPTREVERAPVSQLDAEDWAEASASLTGLAVYSNADDGLTLTGQGAPEKIATTYVSDGFFPTLGVEAQRGRTLGPDDARTDDRRVVVSHAFWQRRFAGDPDVVGISLVLDDRPFTVAGVMPESFRFPDADTEVWAFLSLIPEESIPTMRFVRWLDAVGRLAPDASPAIAEAEVSEIARQLEERFPRENEGASAVTVEPLQRAMVGDVGRALWVLLGAVGLVLLIACANVGHLMLARGLARRSEIAVRSALGAGRGRLVRQLLHESLLLALVGGGAGVLLAYWGVDALATLAAGVLPRAGEIRVDGAVLSFAVGVSVATALLFGLVPALRASRPDLTRDLRDGRGGGTAGGRSRLRGALVVAEVALAVVLVVAAGLLTRSLTRMLDADTGFDAEHLVALSLVIPDHRYPEQSQYLEMYRQLAERLEAIPGVATVASTKALPLAGGKGIEGASFTIEGRPTPERGQKPQAEWHPVSPSFFRTAGIALLSGRDFTPQDDAERPFVGVVNRTLAEMYFPGEDPLGQILIVGEQARLEIVGLVEDAHHGRVTEAVEPTLYLSHLQASRRVFSFLLRAQVPPDTLLEPVRQAVWEVDPEQPIQLLAPLSRVLSDSVARPRLTASLVGLFAVLALVLAALGLYGVLSYSVGQQAHEIGVRMALGARRRQVLGRVLARGLALGGLGVAVGLLASAGASQLLRGLLFDLEALDPVTYLLAAGGLLAVALTACLLPARRAAATDPMVALRGE